MIAILPIFSLPITIVMYPVDHIPSPGLNISARFHGVTMLASGSRANHPVFPEHACG
jgi:hypothetical protein